MIARDELLEHLNYNKETGVLSWRRSRGRQRAGAPAGSVYRDGYLVTRINGCRISNHRAVWLIEKNSLPEIIDHINRDKTDNRIENLREVTNAQNAQNIIKAHRGNTSGLLGVSWSRQYQKWLSRICINGNNKTIGVFDDPNEAHAAYLTEKRRIHKFFAAETERFDHQVVPK